jgi:2-dehydropantoate 2-reductase
LEERLSWLMFGSGAIGTYIGGSLILHGQKVVFLEQPETALQLIERGLKLNIHGQDHRILHPEVYSSLEMALSRNQFDIVVIALKSFDTPYAIEVMRPFSSSLPPVLCLQNGVDNELAFEEMLGKGQVIAGTVTSSIGRRDGGDIILERKRGVGIIRDHYLSGMLFRILNEAELNVHSFASAAAMKWSKMLTNLLANASSAILDMPPAEVLNNRQLYAVEIAQLREALAIMQGLQTKAINLPGTPVRLFAWAAKKLPVRLSQPFIARYAGHGRGNKMPSFHIDLYSGRGRTEVDYLNGAIVRFGQQLRIPTPVNRWLNQTLMALTSGSLPINEYSHKPEKYLADLYSITYNNSSN